MLILGIILSVNPVFGQGVSKEKFSINALTNTADTTKSKEMSIQGKKIEANELFSMWWYTGLMAHNALSDRQDKITLGTTAIAILLNIELIKQDIFNSVGKEITLKKIAKIGLRGGLLYLFTKNAYYGDGRKNPTSVRIGSAILSAEAFYDFYKRYRK